MNQCKKISVILPVYNGSANLEKSIESVLAQTYKNIELIIVDDCSTDCSPDIIRTYADKDKRVKTIRNHSNQKLPKSLNIGFRKAKGDYYTWTSDDNYYKKDAFEKMVSCLERSSNVALVYADYTEVDADDREIKKVHLKEPQKMGFGNVVGACFLYRKEIAKKAGEYDPDLFLAEDYEYWIRIKKEGKLEHIHEELYFYRIHSKSLTSVKQDKISDAVYRVLEKHFLYLYSTMRTGKEQRDFLEAMENTGRNYDKKQIRRQLYCVNPTYRYRVCYRWIEKKMWEFACGLKRIIRYIGKIGKIWRASGNDFGNQLRR